MTTADPVTHSPVPTEPVESAREPADAGPPAVNPLAGNPGTVGIPTVIAGAIGLGLVNSGYLAPDAAGGAMPIILTATVVGLLIATIWAAVLGQNAAASLYAVFLGFYGSYAALVVGLGHDWYSVPAEHVVTTVAGWIISWLVTIVVVTLVTLRLPWSFTLLLGLVDLALVLLLVGLYGSIVFTRAGAAVIWIFIAVAIYLYADIMSRETGGRGLPLGRPIIRD
jgi:succinate-acetate transporter protein